MLTVMSDPAAAAKPTGSETYSAPAGIVTDAIPPKLSRTLVAGAICGLPRATGRAIAAASIVSGAVPNAFDKRTRTRVPPSESRTVWRSVASVSASSGSALCGSGTCWADPQDATQCGSCAASGAAASVEATSSSDSRSEEHTSELQSLMRSSYAVFCLKKKTTKRHQEDLQYIR